MTDYYKQYGRFYVSVDCVVFGLNEGRLSVLLTRRAFDPGQGRWSLIGGFVRPTESLDSAAHRVLSELTGLDDIYMQQVGAFGEIERDPGARVVSVAYYALVNFDAHDRRKVEEHNGAWVDLSELPELVFDHPQMMAEAMERLRTRFLTEPIGLTLLPASFTLSQLQSLFETVLGHPIDKRNFRKRAMEATCIEPTGEKDRLSSKRGAALYRFNPEVYARDRKFKF